MASRKDYVSAAASIKKIKNPKDRARMTVLFGKKFAADNPRFDWDRWRTACGYRHKLRSYGKYNPVNPHPYSPKRTSGWFDW